MTRTNETKHLTVGQKVSTSGFPGTIVRLYADGPCEGGRMYEVRLASGVACVCGSDIIPASETPTTYDHWEETANERAFGC